MLRRILSVFLLCLCVSPVWGVSQIGPANRGSGYTGPSVSSSSTSYNDYVYYGGESYGCELGTEDATHEYSDGDIIQSLSKGMEAQKCVDMWGPLDDWQELSTQYCSDSPIKAAGQENTMTCIYVGKELKRCKIYGESFKEEAWLDGCVKVSCKSDAYVIDGNGCKKKQCKGGLEPGDAKSGQDCPDNISNANKCNVSCGNDLKLSYTIESCNSGYVLAGGQCKKIGSVCDSSLDNVKKSIYGENGDCVVKECQPGYRLKDGNCNTRTGNCINADLPQFATAGVYNADGKCVATQCKDKTYLVVNASGVSQGWCVADVYCQSVKKLGASKVLNIIDGTKTDLSCVDKPTEVASGGSSASGGEVSGETPTGAAQSSDVTDVASGGEVSGETSTGAAQSSGVTDANVSLSIIPQGDCADSAKRVGTIGENDSCGTDTTRVAVKACVKNVEEPDEVLYYANALQMGVESKGFASDSQGCFNETNIPGNNKYKVSYAGYKPVYVCANQLQEDKVVCLEEDGDTDFADVVATRDCAQEVLTKLNAVSGTRKRWDSPEGQYVTYCDIVCADGDIRQEKETFVEYQDGGDTIRTKQRYICVANGDVTTDNTATPTPGGEDDSGATAPAKPDGTPCTPTDKNAKSGQYQNDECIIVECNGAYYKVSDDKKSCEEDKKAKSQAKIDELQKNADAMKEKEQSTANKLLGGVAIGATGIGAMQAASAYSEQQADEEAEQAMKAYLATFHCNYGGGINVQGGEKEVQLPGGNELINLYAEYVNLANNLKVRKAALDMRPGIESEAILDSATSGLYDDVAIGKTSGAFTSLARALMDPEGEDAKAWAAQKDDSAQKMKTGLTMAGIGAVGGAVGNLLINKNSEKENSKDILDKYKDDDLTGKVSKSPDGKLVAEAVNQESKPETGITIRDDNLGQETNMDQKQNGTWVHIEKNYAVGFYCEDLFSKVYKSCFAMNNEDYARFQQSKFSEITNNAEKCYQGLVNCKQDSHTLAGTEEVCIRAVASEFSIDVSGANNADCTDNYKTDFTWVSHIFQEQSTVNADATVSAQPGQMIVQSPDPDNTGKSVETVVEETQESTPKQDNVVMEHDVGNNVDYIKRIENITDADAAFNKLAQQFGKTPSNEVKNTYDGFVQKCREYNGVLSIELDTLRSYERDMYQVLCYFPDLDQTPDIVKVAYDTDKRVFDNSVSISEGIRLSKQAPFKDTQYKQNEDKFWQRLTEFNSTWSNSRKNCKIPELPGLWACTKYSAMIRIHDRDGKMYLEMTRYERPGGNSDNYFVGK